jgi:hypothetical protein
MNSRLAKRLKYGAIGFVYGVFLSVFAFAYSGGGHGTYVPMLVFTAPLVFSGYVAAVFLTPFLWLVMGIALSGTGKCSYWFPIGLIVLHWVSAICLVVAKSEPHDWMVMQRCGLGALGIFSAVFGIYLAGQIAVVSVLLRRYRQMVSGLPVKE